MKITENVLKNLNEFPTLPTIYNALTEVLDNPRATPQDAADIISTDQAAASKVLRAANSPIYGHQGRIDTVTKAIFFIGFKEVKNLVAALSIMDLFSQRKKILYFNPVEFWKYSVGVGIINRAIAQEVGVPNAENYLLAGILHDIGKLLLYEVSPAEFGLTLMLINEKKIPAREAFMKVFGITNTVIGEMLASKWKLPLTIRNAVRYHTTGMVVDKPDPLVASVHIAMITARCFELGNCGEAMIPPPNPEAFAVLNLNDRIFSTNAHQIVLDFEEATSALLI